jgi:arylsulfatase A-like enzyme
MDDWASYMDCLRFTDKQIGEILQRLENEGLLNNTLIILMGDNGISHARGKQFLYDEGIRTPFIVRGPGIKAGAIRTDLIEHIDMGAISFGFSGIKVPAWMQGQDVFSKKYKKRKAVFAARDRAGETVDRIRAVRTNRFKYIRNFYPDRPHLQPSNYKDSKEIIIRLRELHSKGELNELQEKLFFTSTRPSEELYDIIADPFETINLAGQPKYSKELKKMREILTKWSIETNDPDPETPEIYDLEMEHQIGKTRSKIDKAKIYDNVELMKRWQTERPYKKK